MTIFDFVLILAVLACVIALFLLGYFLLRRQWGVVTTHGMFYLVTVRVSSWARGISQRALDAQVYLLDASNQRFDPDASGQRALDATGQGGQPLDSKVAPGGSFTRTVVFNLPKGSSHLVLVVTHGLFPDVLIIGSEQSFLHKPTIFQLQVP